MWKDGGSGSSRSLQELGEEGVPLAGDPVPIIGGLVGGAIGGAGAFAKKLRVGVEAVERGGDRFGRGHAHRERREAGVVGLLGGEELGGAGPELGAGAVIG